MKTFLDTEYVPGQADWIREHVIDGISAPANYKDQAKIDAYIKGKADKAYRDSAFNSTFGELVCISWAHGDGDVHSVSRQLAESEAALLEGFFNQIQDSFPTDPKFDSAEWGIDRHFEWVGFMILSDLRYIWRRAIINNVKIPFPIPVDAKPWDKNPLDIVNYWKCDRYDSASASMNVLCKVFGIEGKEGFDGSMVYDAMLAGEEKKVREYCEDDIRRTRAVYNRLF